jgi:2-polyprenyl-3-methyl-5-hydroxy-6-metoxy-1,4-benzoquinol methylase
MGGDATLNDHTLERLDPADVDAGGLLAATHVHRYEFAASLCTGLDVLDLCCGTGYGSALLSREAGSVVGVDVSPEAISSARAIYGTGPGTPTFETGDALAFLRALPQGRFGAVVCFEGIEHVPDPEAVVDELARLAQGGARIILSLPNSRGFEEENEFHVTEFGYEEMQALVSRLPEPVMLEQRLAEASVIARVSDAPRELRGWFENRDGDPAWANHWIAAVGVETGELESATARLTVAMDLNQSRYMRALEEANADLRRINAQLGREHLGRHDAAVANVVRRIEEQRDAGIREAEARRNEAEARRDDAERRLAIEVEVARRNDELFQQARAQLAKRPHRLILGLERRASRIPGVRRLAR